ncbi:uncharacterized protein V1518DRAFT_419869 [Limtongia smithiae]|uniref:uncharacterized protein n=1 Tax=Limtongia smithiae TaxID=1125753 RepID=UPI0034CFE972
MRSHPGCLHWLSIGVRMVAIRASTWQTPGHSERLCASLVSLFILYSSIYVHHLRYADFYVAHSAWYPFRLLAITRSSALYYAHSFLYIRLFIISIHFCCV